MLWVIVFLGLGLAAAVFLVFWIRWLAHQVIGVRSEVVVLLTRVHEMQDLLGSIGAPEPTLPAAHGAVEKASRA